MSLGTSARKDCSVSASRDIHAFQQEFINHITV
jgi:hypothetical protein